MTYSFYNILPSLLSSPSAMLGQGFLEFLPYGILLLLFAFCTFLPSLLQQMGTNSPQKTQTMIMMGIMSLFMLWLGWGSPYWRFVLGNFFRIRCSAAGNLHQGYEAQGRRSRS